MTNHGIGATVSFLGNQLCLQEGPELGFFLVFTRTKLHELSKDSTQCRAYKCMGLAAEGAISCSKEQAASSGYQQQLVC